MSEKGVWEIYLVVVWRRRRESKKGFLVWGQGLRRDSGAQIQQTLSDQLWTLCVRCIVFLCQVKCWLLCSFPSSEYVPRLGTVRFERCEAPYTHTSSPQHKKEHCSARHASTTCAARRIYVGTPTNIRIPGRCLAEGSPKGIGKGSGIAVACRRLSAGNDSCSSGAETTPTSDINCMHDC